MRIRLTSKHRRSATTAAAILAGGAFASHALAGSATITVSQTSAGKSLQYVGYNQGHYLPGSNTSAWVDYAGVNAFRVWATSSDYEIRHGSEANRDDFGPWGDGVSDLASFNARKTALRANPLSQTYIDWIEFNDRFQNTTQSGRNAVKLNHILGEMKARDIHVMQQTTRSVAAGPITGESDWAGKWEQWQHYYAMAFHSARNYDVSQFQMYNEPDADTNTNQTDWVLRLKLASDAIRSAVTDVNTLYGKNLVPDIAAPTSAGGSSKVDGNGDPTRAWGKAALQNIRTDYQGNTVGYDIFNTYAAQVYGQTGSSFGSEVAGIKSKIPIYHAGGAAAGQAMPVIFSEFNRHTSNNFADMPENLETPYVFTDLASIYVNAMQQGTKAMYAFKFSQTLWTPDGSTAPEPQKTGFHYVSDAGLKDVTGATHGAGVVRLVAKAFKDERTRLGTSSSATLSSFDSATSYDPTTDNYYFFGVNRHATDPHNITFDLTSWNIAPGTMVSVEEVRNETSAAHNGEVVQMVPVGSDRRIALTMPTRSVWLLTVPGGDKQTPLSVSPTADAAVHNASPTTNFGTATTADVGRTPTNNAFDRATYLKFSLNPATDAADVNRAILRVSGKSVTDGNPSANPGPILFHVYALAGDTWNESTINWTNAPNLDDPDAKANGVGATAFPVGQLTFAGGTTQRFGIDITKFLQDHPELFDDGQISFALVREERFAGDADAASSYVNLFTKESGGGLAPELTLFQAPQSTPRTIYWDANGALGAGAGGAAPAGAWNGTATNFNLDSTGGATGGVLPTTTAADTVVFTAGSDGVGSYTVTLTGTQSAAAVNVSRGNVTFAGGTLATGVFNISAGATATVASAISAPVNAVTKSGAGTLQVSKLPQNHAINITAGKLTVFASSPTLPSHPSGSNASLSRPSALSISNNGAPLGPSRVYNGTLDLTNNDLIVDYTGASPIASIEDMIRAGFNVTGDWQGSGITSSLAALDGNYVLAVADNALLSAPFGTVQGGPLFAGVDVDLTTILVKFTHRADINLDGVITADDAAIFGGNYDENAFARWSTGDMNYDGKFTPDDAAIFGAFYDESLTSLPEPAATAFALLGVALGARPRRRRARRRD